MSDMLKNATVLGAAIAAAIASSSALADAAGAESQASKVTKLEEVIVTAQKREENLQDVPVAVTALGTDAMQVNRILSLNDLGSVATGFSVLQQGGISGLPQIVTRGARSDGGTPGSDKAVGILLDGVSIGDSYAVSFDMLDLERIEVLRGPQGTLFGRNTTGGAVNFITHDPTGEFGIRQSLTTGNFNQFKSVTRVELPAMGSFSAYVSYMYNQQDGDIKNSQSGIVFDRNNAPGYGLEKSASTLGYNKTDAWRIGVKFEPNDQFDTIYKFDHTNTDMTPRATALVVLDRNLAHAYGLDAFLYAYDLDPVPVAGTHRPNSARSAFTTVGNSNVTGHTLTSDWHLNDQLLLKNILAYRETKYYGSDDYGGLGQMHYYQGGDPFYVFANQSASESNQWSDELQLHYNTSLMTLTLGALYYDQHAKTGDPDGLKGAGSLSFVPIPGNVMPPGRDLTVVDVKSKAAFGQAEFHVTSQVDLVGGLRYTQDNKDGTSFVATVPNPYTYSDDRTTYNLGATYRPTEDVTLYGKYSTGYISGGAIAGVAFKPETAASWELGVKSDLFDQRLRANVALFDVDYKDVQQPVPGYLIGRNDLGLVLISMGDAKAKGLELELAAVLARGLTLSGSYSYTDFEWTKLAPIFGSPKTFPVWIRPKETATVAAGYDTVPLFGDSPLSFRLDANWYSKVITPGMFGPQPGFEGVYQTGDNWIVNARIALSNMSLGNKGKVEVAAWARNLLDNDGTAWGGYFGFYGNTTYVPARTYGLDVNFEF